MREDELGSFDPLDYRNIAKTVVRELLAADPAPLGTLEPFDGAGIYALYYTGPFEAYAPISGPEPSVPIYVGKAIPRVPEPAAMSLTLRWAGRSIAACESTGARSKWQTTWNSPISCAGS